MLVPRNHLLVITAHQKTIVEAIDIEEEYSEKVQEAPSNDAEVKNEIEETLASEWDLTGQIERITGEEELREVRQDSIYFNRTSILYLSATGSA